jgi:mycofactocin system creatininase family protein
VRQLLSEMTWPDVAQAVANGATTVILPLGATEQHGPHLPLGTDTFRAAALAKRLAAQLPGSLVAPVLPIGCSDEHTGFPGLFSLSSETLAAVIVDCAQRMVGWGVHQLILLSAHGGNEQALALAGERLRQQLPQLCVWLPATLTQVAAPLLAIAEEDAISPEMLGLHAGEGETSEMLYLHPELVRMEYAVPGHTGDMVEILPRLREVGLRPLAPNGILGDPRPARAARGERYLLAEVESYQEIIPKTPLWPTARQS